MQSVVGAAVGDVDGEADGDVDGEADGEADGDGVCGKQGVVAASQLPRGLVSKVS